MNREIKFRVWLPARKIFAFVNMQGLGTFMFEPEGANNFGELYNYEPSESMPSSLMQYTGLKDKNVKEIYEGDILKWKNLLLDGTEEFEDGGTVQVVFECGYWLLKKVSGTDLGRWGLWKNIDDQDTENDISFEIIGDIYQDSELLK